MRKPNQRASVKPRPIHSHAGDIPQLSHWAIGFVTLSPSDSESTNATLQWWYLLARDAKARLTTFSPQLVSWPVSPMPAPKIEHPVTLVTAKHQVETVLPASTLFDVDSSQLQAGAGLVLQAALSLLMKYPSAPARVDGYSDPTGNQAINLPLSTARAQAVATWLEGHGIAQSRLTVAGHGDTNLVGSGPNAYQLDRRVTVSIFLPGN